MPSLDNAERLARTRSLRAIALLVTGPLGDNLVSALRTAETDPAALAPALAAFEALPAIPRRRILAAMAELGRPPRRTAPRALECLSVRTAP